MPQQIAAFFLRLAVQSRQQVDEGEIHEEDISATVEESNFDDVRKNVNQNVNLQHPIIVDQYDVCQLVHNKELKKITINMMEKLCLELGLAMPNHPPPPPPPAPCAAGPLMNRHWRKLLPCAPAVYEL